MSATFSQSALNRLLFLPMRLPLSSWGGMKRAGEGGQGQRGQEREGEGREGEGWKEEFLDGCLEEFAHLLS